MTNTEEEKTNEKIKKNTSKKNIGIMGGTFDPIHYGHLVTAETVYDAFDIEKILFIPTGSPAHKCVTLGTNHRLEMTKLAVRNNEKFEISTIEIDRGGKTYTVDTIEELTTQLEDDTTFYFIMGADSIHQLEQWKDTKRLLSLCEFIGVTRPGYDKKGVEEAVAKLNEAYGAKIHFLEVPALDISSSDIRDRIEHGTSIRYLLPDDVLAYIHKFQLYSDKEGGIPS
ncbi:MAG: nicotinate-nucleotide adenylyltransferase [Bacillota bacterium]